MASSCHGGCWNNTEVPLLAALDSCDDVKLLMAQPLPKSNYSYHADPKTNRH
jgi:hypothetical protein